MLVLGAILLIIIVAFGVARFLGWKGGPGGLGDDVVRTELPAAQYPDRVPTDLPDDPQATVTQNAKIVSPDGRVQETRAYDSDFSLEEQEKRFDAYFAGNGWKIEDKKSFNGYRAYLATRGAVRLQVTLNAFGAGSNVNVVATVAPASTSSR